MRTLLLLLAFISIIHHVNASEINTKNLDSIELSALKDADKDQLQAFKQCLSDSDNTNEAPSFCINEALGDVHN